MLFYSFFKSLVGKEVTVELKNDLGITGMLHSVDQYLNIKLQDIYVTCPGMFYIFKLIVEVLNCIYKTIRKISPPFECEKLFHSWICREFTTIWYPIILVLLYF